MRVQLSCPCSPLAYLLSSATSLPAYAAPFRHCTPRTVTRPAQADDTACDGPPIPSSNPLLPPFVASGEMDNTDVILIPWKLALIGGSSVLENLLLARPVQGRHWQGGVTVGGTRGAAPPSTEQNAHSRCLWMLASPQRQTAMGVLSSWAPGVAPLHGGPSFRIDHWIISPSFAHGGSTWEGRDSYIGAAFG